jgi:hypothetical protein
MASRCREQDRDLPLFSLQSQTEPGSFPSGLARRELFLVKTEVTLIS